jgi:hypothetical protein
MKYLWLYTDDELFAPSPLSVAGEGWRGWVEGEPLEIPVLRRGKVKLHSAKQSFPFQTLIDQSQRADPPHSSVIMFKYFILKRQSHEFVILKLVLDHWVLLQKNSARTYGRGEKPLVNVQYFWI